MNKITEGMVKAMMSLATEPDRLRKKRAENPRVTYVDSAIGFHAKRALKPDERESFEDLKKRVAAAKTSDERKPLFDDLKKLPVKSVILRAEVRQDRSRYTGKRLREIRAKGEWGTSRARRAMANPNFAAAA